MATRYKVSYKGTYLFHVYGTSEDDAQREAKLLTSRTMREEVTANLTVDVDAV